MSDQGMKLCAEKVYLCCGNKTGVENPSEWVGVDIQEPCDIKVDVRDIARLDCRVVLATPPCDSFTDLPWRPATNLDSDILIHCLKLCKQAPLWLLENNLWAQRIIGRADFHRGGHYFWGNLLVADFVHIKKNTAGQNPLRRAALPEMVIVA